MGEDASLAPLADRLRALRADTGLTLRELSRKVHVSDSSLSRYFAGQALPAWEVVEAIADLAGADQVELRQCWESVSQARKRARWPEPNDSAAERQVPLWEPERPAQVPATAVTAGAGRRVGLLVVVVVLVAAASAAGWSLRGEDHIAVSVPAAPRPGVTGGIPTAPGTASTPSATPSLGPSTVDQPARLAPAATPSSTLSPVPTRATNPARKPTPSAPTASPAPLLSGAVIALTNNDSPTGSVPYVIDVANWSMDDGARVHLWYRRTDGDYRNQLWTAEKVTPQYWRFVNVYSGKCLSRDTGGSMVQTGCTGDATQQWTFGHNGEIHSATDGACVEIKGHQRLTDADLWTAACDDDWYQRWHAEQRSLG